MELAGGCHCGAVRYRVDGAPMHVALCHCSDCRKSSGAPMVSWAMFKAGQFALTQGEVTTHNSSGASMRNFCHKCGTGLFFTNAETLPDIIDVQSATFDDPDLLPAQVHIQTAERLGWMADQHALPAFARFPGEE